MLSYVSSGPRDFGDHPLVPVVRPVWEFYAVTEGRLAPWFARRPPVLSADTLWLFPPGNEHGWLGQPGRKSVAVVFHYTEIPAALVALVPPDRPLALPLSATEKRTLLSLARELQPHHWQPSPLLEYYAQYALMALTVLILRKSLPAPPVAPLASSPAARVLAAENWYREHLIARPSLGELARFVGTSEGHLRRLFHAERGRSPKTVMRALQLGRVEELLKSTDLKIEAIARECGFVNGRSLYTVFRARHRLTPDAWRRLHRVPHPSRRLAATR